MVLLARSIIVTKEYLEKDNEAGSYDCKNVFIKLKKNESIKVRVLSLNDYFEYWSHSFVDRGINIMPCNETLGEDCAMCKAAEYTGELDIKRPYIKYCF